MRVAEPIKLLMIGLVLSVELHTTSWLVSEELAYFKNKYHVHVPLHLMYTLERIKKHNNRSNFRHDKVHVRNCEHKLHNWT